MASNKQANNEFVPYGKLNNSIKHKKTLTII